MSILFLKKNKNDNKKLIILFIIAHTTSYKIIKTEEKYIPRSKYFYNEYNT